MIRRVECIELEVSAKTTLTSGTYIKLTVDIVIVIQALAIIQLNVVNRVPYLSKKSTAGDP